MRLPDPQTIQDELELISANDVLNSDKTKTKQFGKSLEEQVKFNFLIEIRVNVLNYKYRCLQYLKKIYAIYDNNFIGPNIKTLL